MLRVENVIDPEDADFVLVKTKTQQTALQAHHMGCTRFTSEQIRCLAAFVIDQMASYNLFQNNCQLFSISLGARTVMAQRNNSILVGNKHQLGCWDVAGGISHAHYYCHPTDYVLIDPSPDPGTWLGQVRRRIDVSHKALSIAILYRDGEEALGAFDPPGEGGVQPRLETVSAQSSMVDVG
jgi:hypothetical protein